LTALIEINISARIPPPIDRIQPIIPGCSTMGLNAGVLQRQLKSAEARLDACVASLKEQGVEEADWACCPEWRNADADRRQAKRRLNAADALRNKPAAAEEAEE
jgi:hypothetical protein